MKKYSILLAIVLIFAVLLCGCNGVVEALEDYDVAYNDGYDAGYDEGYDDGLAKGKADAKAQYDAGYAKGLAEGKADAKAQYDAGYAKGLADGKADAKAQYDEGYDDGYDEGYDDGLAKGKADAKSQYDAGYAKGLAEGKAQGTATEEIELDTIGMEVHFVDVGQGDAIIVRFADGTDIIVDAGSGTSEKKATTDEYIAYLNEIQIGTIDYMIATHVHSDHMNMLDNVLANFEVKNIWYNGYSTKPTQVFFTGFETGVDAEGATVVQFDGDGDIYNLKTGDYAVTVYAPGYDEFDNINYESPIILVEYAGVKVLLTGDAEEDAEALFMQRCGLTSLDVDVLKVGHHGSKAGTSEAFLDFITPEFAVISAGDGNSYGHPTSDTMNDLFDDGIITYRTDRQGNIVLKVDKNGEFAFFVENDVPADNNKYRKPERMIALEQKEE